MKALSLTQPWATLVVTGEKEIETRSWRTNHHGMIAIHASKGFPKDARRLCWRTPFFESLRVGAHELPTGAIIGVASIIGCVSTDGIKSRLRYEESEFGDYADGRWAWLLSEPQMVEPIPCRGALSLWEVPSDITTELLIRIGLRDRPSSEASRRALSQSTEKVNR